MIPSRVGDLGRRPSWRRAGVVLLVLLGGWLLVSGCASSSSPSASSSRSGGGRAYQPGTFEDLAELQNADLRLERLVLKGDSVRLPSDTPITLRFGELGRISGNSAVNGYFGSFQFKEGGVVSWPLAALGLTRKAGPPAAMELEGKFIQALTSTTQLELASGGARFTNADGSMVLEFVR